MREALAGRHPPQPSLVSSHHLDMKNKLRAWKIVSAAALAVPGVTYVASGNVQFPAPNPVPRDQNYLLRVGSPVPVAPFRHTTLGDFTGDGLVDCVLRRGDGVEMMIDPGLFESWMSNFAPGTTAIATLPKESLTGQDELLVAGFGGLRRLIWHGQEPDFWFKEPLGTSAWVDARRLRVEAYVSERDVVGLLADGRTFLRLEKEGGLWREVPMFTLAVDVVDFVVFQLDEGAPEIGLMTPTGLEVRDFTGQLIYSWYQYAVTSDALVRLEDASEARQRLAWIVTGPTGAHQFIGTYGLEGLVIQDAYLGNPEIVAATAGDVDGDGRADIHLSYRADQAVAINIDLRENEASPVFRNYEPGGIEIYHYGTPGAPAPNNQTFPAVGDVDNDGDRDFCIATPSSSLFVHKGSHVAESGLQPRLVLDSETETADATLSGAPGEPFELTLSFVVDTPFPAGMTHAEFVLMEKEDPGTPTNNVTYPPVRVALPAGLTDPGTWQSTVTLVLPETVPALGEGLGFDTIYLWFQRLVDVGPDRLRQVGPACAYGLEARVTDEAEQYLTGFSTDEISYAVSYQAGGGALLTSGTPEEISTVNELQCLPDLPPDKPPVIPQQ